MNKLLILLLLLYSISCNKSALESEIKKASKEEDYLLVAKLCSDYKGNSVKKECLEGLEKSEEEIQKIISEKQELPFTKLMIQPEKQKKIEELLTKNIHLGIKYRSIWKETSEKY